MVERERGCRDGRGGHGVLCVSGERTHIHASNAGLNHLNTTGCIADGTQSYLVKDPTERWLYDLK